MEAQELRIGNYVNLTNEAIKDFYRVAEVKLNKEQLVESLLKEGVLIEYDMELFNYTEIEPIPLTEEWLLKFGFEISMASVTHNHSFKINGFKVDNLLRGGFFYYRDLEIKHVHKLQNLYFALTNKELKTE